MTIKLYSLLVALHAALTAKEADKLKAACDLASFCKKTLAPVAAQELKGLSAEDRLARATAIRLRKMAVMALADLWPFLTHGQQKDVAQRLGGDLKAVRLNANGNGYALDYKA